MTHPIELKPHVKPSPVITVPVWVARKLLRLSHTLLTSPAIWALAALAWALWALSQVATFLAASLALICLVPLGFCAVHFPETFQTQVAGRIRGSLRSLFVYRWRWGYALKTCGVISRWRDAPMLLRTNSTPEFDRLRVKMIAGQRVEDFSEKADRLGQTFNSLGCRVSALQGKPQWLELMFLTKDPLVHPVAPYPPEPDVLVKGLPIATREDGKPWRLKLAGSHLLLVGATGAGKSSVIWGIIHALIPAVQSKLVKLWVLDPKGGMELVAGKPWFDRFAYGSKPSAFATVLDDAVKVMQHRQERMRGVSRQHEPTQSEPLIVVVVDEMAALTAWATDRRAQARMKSALALLLSQGRAVGVTVMGAVQDPRKDTIPQRDLFPIRIALRLNEASQVNMVLGAGAHERGALCEQVPDTLRGVGYVMVDGEVDPIRVRFAHVTDAMISNGKKVDLPEYVEPAPQRASVYSLPL